MSPAVDWDDLRAKAVEAAARAYAPYSRYPVGAAALGNPANGVAWLARKLHSFGVSLNPGDVVLSGSLGGAVDARKGDTFTVEVHGQSPLVIEFV